MSEEAMTKLLNAIEIESSYYGLNLNKDKCMTINMNGENKVLFINGQPLQTVDKSTYLGGILVKDIDNKVEINARIASCIPVMSSLYIFWKKAECIEKWKLMVFNAAREIRTTTHSFNET